MCFLCTEIRKIFIWYHSYLELFNIAGFVIYFSSHAKSGDIFITLFNIAYFVIYFSSHARSGDIFIIL